MNEFLTRCHKQFLNLKFASNDSTGHLNSLGLAADTSLRRLVSYLKIKVHLTSRFCYLLYKGPNGVSKA